MKDGEPGSGSVDDGPGVRLVIDVLELLAREVRVHLRGGDVGVAEHLLDGAEVATSGQQVRGERMAQRMRAHAVFEAAGLRMPLDDLVQALAAQPASALIDEQVRFVLQADELRALIADLTRALKAMEEK
mgnify:CR=1 FL=1